MKVTTILAFLAASLTFVAAEVPQEHSHDLIVNQVRNIIRKGNNQEAFTRVDPIFALLGDGAARGGIAQDPKLTSDAQRDPSCLQQNIADECISNAKRTGNDRNEIATCIQFRALEKNTIGIGLRSAQCNQTPKNAEINGLKQHQDPAADGATAENKAIEIEVGRRIFALGGFSAEQATNLALQTATFAPGDRNDFTFKGNTCDTFNPLPRAPQAGVVFGRQIAQGDEIDCITLDTLTNGRSKY
ncbi:hypothetical protein HDU96_007618, partial [Phlyctochytrium bullatum]